ncbi:oligoendopeptidase F family protein [Methanoplanus sp. FWC-SCC4]|uniref:Oligoendopeptidase F family protein n=1 Tax=Methanochimaera problematica TaxID=2609417 RepID=A0AA97FBW0_9EURY|nr:hypothetical protein [Methanoplanus sp. FWC-SCC4]WOF16600.1 oligoendopeptidase F family protein [Methanoplanus sp. FWC-SCC4]
MSIITDAVKEIEKKMQGSGCDHGDITLETDPLIIPCPYVSGKGLLAKFGGKVSELTTSYPIEAVTRMSFMYGKTLNSPKQRTAASAIINVISVFMCFTRVSKACDEESYPLCLRELKSEIGDKKVYLNGNMPGLMEMIPLNITKSPDEAEIIIVSGDGIFGDEELLITEKYLEEKRVIFIGPTTLGVCAMNGYEHWCPYGRK